MYALQASRAARVAKRSMNERKTSMYQVGSTVAMKRRAEQYDCSTEAGRCAFADSVRAWEEKARSRYAARRAKKDEELEKLIAGLGMEERNGDGEAGPSVTMTDAPQEFGTGDVAGAGRASVEMATEGREMVASSETSSADDQEAISGCAEGAVEKDDGEAMDQS